MRKSNWMIAAVLLLASVAFLWIWHALQFDLVDNPLDIVVTVVWWVVIVAACVAIHWAEKKRQERIRTIFVAPGLLYNSEMGVVRLSPDDEVVDALQAILSNLTYGFELAELPGRAMSWRFHAPIAPGSSMIAMNWPLWFAAPFSKFL